MRYWPVSVLLVLAACDEAPKAPPSRATTPAVTPVAPPTSPRSEPCREGWIASRTRWIDEQYLTSRVECIDGSATLMLTDLEPSGEVDTKRYAVSPELWDRLWRDLERARWRTLDVPCPEADLPASSVFTGMDILVTDGTATKKLSCNATSVTPRHEQIEAAINKVVVAILTAAHA
jgi:hypothetical protein